jgi:hypothetical protein
MEQNVKDCKNCSQESPHKIVEVGGSWLHVSPSRAQSGEKMNREYLGKADKVCKENGCGCENPEPKTEPTI